MRLQVPGLNRRSILVGLGLAVVVAGAVGFWIAATQPARSLERDWRFVQQVLLTREQDGAERPITRWSKSPVVFALVREGNDRRRFERVVTTINDALRRTGFTIRAHFEKGQPHDIVFGILDIEDFDHVMTGYGCLPTLGTAAGAGCILSSASYEIAFAAAMAATLRHGDKFEATMLEELYQSLGVANDHAVYPQSITFDDGEVLNLTPRLAPIDIQVLRFLYMYLEPGDDTATVRAKFNAHWADVPMD